MNDTNDIKKSAEIHFSLGTELHITFKSGRWARGKILEIHPDYLILDEPIDGKIPIPYNDILAIEARRKR